MFISNWKQNWLDARRNLLRGYLTTHKLKPIQVCFSGYSYTACSAEGTFGDIEREIQTRFPSKKDILRMVEEVKKSHGNVDFEIMADDHLYVYDTPRARLEGVSPEPLDIYVEGVVIYSTKEMV
jgi:hypothetical protein